MTSTEHPTILILGGGIGGQVAATRLVERVGERARVVLVERAGAFTFPPSLLWLMVGQREAQSITRDYSALARRGVEVVRASVTGLDTTASSVDTDAGPLHYDYLLIALGAEHMPALLPGAETHAHHPYDLGSAERLRDTLAAFEGGRVVVAIASLPYRCPAAPYETAMLIDDFLRRRRLRGKSSIDFFTPEPLPLPVAGAYAGHSVAALLAERGITLHTRAAVQSVGPDSMQVDGTEIGHDLAVVIPPHRPPAAMASSGLTGATGWVMVDRATLRTRASNVWAVGDVTAIPLENGMILPKAGVFAHAEAEVAAENIARAITGVRGDAEFDGHGSCFVEAGAGRAGMARGAFFASPAPAVTFRAPGRLWHFAKVGFERYWLRRWL